MLVSSEEEDQSPGTPSEELLQYFWVWRTAASEPVVFLLLLWSFSMMESHWTEALKAQTYTGVRDLPVVVMLAPPSGHKCF